MSLLRGDVHRPLGDDLLALAERYVVEVFVVGGEAELSSELFDVFERIDARREDEEDGRARTGLVERLGEVDAAAFDVLCSEFFFDEISINAKGVIRDGTPFRIN